MQENLAPVLLRYGSYYSKTKYQLFCKFEKKDSIAHSQECVLFAICPVLS